MEIAVQHQTMFSTGFPEEMKQDADLLDVISSIRLAIDTRSLRRGAHRLHGDQDAVRERHHALSLR